MAAVGEFAGKVVQPSSWKNIFKPSIDGAKGLVAKAEGKEVGLKPGFGFNAEKAEPYKLEGFGNKLTRHPFSTATGVGAAGVGGAWALGGKKKEGDSFESQSGQPGGAPPASM
jgi:hypothetical protein